jgi:hypothetical protein
MNIFILSNEINPAKHYHDQAISHIDRHVVKMIAESTQMLVTALTFGKLPNMPTYVPDNVAQVPCRPLAAGMSKHPCTAWTSESLIHFNYLTRLAIALCQEHQYRYPLSPEHTYYRWLRNVGKMLDAMSLTIDTPLPRNFAVAVKSVALRSTDTPHHSAVVIYRDYYVQDKLKFSTWKGRAKPIWFLMREEELVASNTHYV